MSRRRNRIDQGIADENDQKVNQVLNIVNIDQNNDKENAIGNDQKVNQVPNTVNID